MLALRLLRVRGSARGGSALRIRPALGCSGPAALASGELPAQLAGKRRTEVAEVVEDLAELAAQRTEVSLSLFEQVSHPVQRLSMSSVHPVAPGRRVSVRCAAEFRGRDQPSGLPKKGKGGGGTGSHLVVLVRWLPSPLLRERRGANVINGNEMMVTGADEPKTPRAAVAPARARAARPGPSADASSPASEHATSLGRRRRSRCQHQAITSFFSRILSMLYM